MDPSSAQLHHQEMSSQTLESMLVCTKAQQDKKPRPPEQALKCPRCDSSNTKFCYYNNYSLTQPRYFCKSCRRYWTKGGTLRNVPVGGGCRKNKRSSSSSSSSKRGQDQSIVSTNMNPLSSLSNLSYESDISLALARLQKHSNGHLGFDDHDLPMQGNPNNPHCEILGNHGHHHHHHHASAAPGFFDALRGGILENQNGFHNLYYDHMSNNGNMGHVENGGLGIHGSHEEMSMMPYDQEIGGATTTATTVTTVKQEICNARDGESKVLWGFPWQVGGGEANMGDIDSGRQSWTGFGSSWHGLLNSAPLM